MINLKKILFPLTLIIGASGILSTIISCSSKANNNELINNFEIISPNKELNNDDLIPKLNDIQVTEKGKNKFLEISTIIKNSLNNGVTLYDILKFHLIGNVYSKYEWIELNNKHFFEKNIAKDNLWKVNFDKENWVIKFIIPFFENNKIINKKLLLKFNKPKNINQSSDENKNLEFYLNIKGIKSYLEFKNIFENALFNSGSVGDAISNLSEKKISWLDKKIKPGFIEELSEYTITFNDEDQVAMIKSVLVSEKDLELNVSNPKKYINYSFLKFENQTAKIQNTLSKNLSNEYEKYKYKTKDIEIELGELTKNNYLDFKTWIKVWASTIQISNLFRENFVQGFPPHNENQIRFKFNDETIKLKDKNWNVEFDDDNLIIKVTIKYSKIENGRNQIKTEDVYLKFDNRKTFNEEIKSNKFQISLKEKNKSYQEFIEEFRNNLYSNKHISDAIIKMSKGENAWFNIINKFDTINDELYLEGWTIEYNEEDKAIALTTSFRSFYKKINDSDEEYYDYNWYYTVIEFNK
ncbi:hypothetical protein [[Mycoplasma] collis]|uniref:hypothetical protein n=1 Tax=[Mycoplasma] collis TaxID=2127 RepID=UPI00051B3C7B|nr:hypothetical protein [[Mycoplasma] collis]